MNTNFQNPEQLEKRLAEIVDRIERRAEKSRTANCLKFAAMRIIS